MILPFRQINSSNNEFAALHLLLFKRYKMELFSCESELDLTEIIIKSKRAKKKLRLSIIKLIETNDNHYRELRQTSLPGYFE